MLKISLKFLWILNHELQIMNYESGIKNVKRMVVFSRKYFFFLTFNQKPNDSNFQHCHLLFGISIPVKWKSQNERVWSWFCDYFADEWCIFHALFG